MFFKRRRKAEMSVSASQVERALGIGIRVVGVGGGGGNAVRRMVGGNLAGVRYLVLNTDIQALRGLDSVPTFAIGPNTTGGMGSGGQPAIGRKAMRESQKDVSKLLEGADMVFVAVGMGGGTGTGAASLVADIARKRGALTVGVATLPFGFEGPRRREGAEEGLNSFRQKVDTLIVVENDRLLPALDGKIELERAFKLADEALHQGVRGISDIITMNGMINVDFADVKAVMSNGGSAFMAMGTGQGNEAAAQAAQAALSNPLFDMPMEGAKGILLNIMGGPDLTLGEVHQVAEIIKDAASADANVIFGVVQDKRMKRKVSLTLVGTGIEHAKSQEAPQASDDTPISPRPPTNGAPAVIPAINGHAPIPLAETQSML